MAVRCMLCGRMYGVDEAVTRCTCGGLLDVVHPLHRHQPEMLRATFDGRLCQRRGILASGVWRYRELVADFADDDIVSKPEGNTNLYDDRRLADWAGIASLALKHEGENPTASFKDRGMTVAVSHARRVGARVVACASTGNTSASLAAYAAAAGMTGLTFVPDGKLSMGKLSQTVAYGATVVQVRGDFDAAMRLVQAVASRGGVYLLNSLNPWRLEGQKSIAFDIMHALNWQAPDWLVLPGGNLGNCSAVGKALEELQAVGLLDRLPRLGVIQAAGANPFYRAYRGGWATYQPVTAATVATAIQIGDPVSYARARRAVELTNGVVEEVTDAEIMAAKAAIDRAGIGCEPASAATLAGLRKLVGAGIVPAGASVVGILTGHLLKDQDANLSAHTSGAFQPVVVEPTLAAVESLLAAL
ncbi:MAG: threonine synthase [Chloroflexi bacterium]|nr:threonine synthase [Chloroflexota bacterium]